MADLPQLSPDAGRQEFSGMAACGNIIMSVAAILSQPDAILRQIALTRLAAISEEVKALANGKVVFTATEAWRATYEQILCLPDVRLYQSVAWIRNEDYWQDAPGRRSMQLNYDLRLEGVRIERILILCDFFWPKGALLPAADIRRWIDEQHNEGLWIGLVRESDIEGEPDLLTDIGIYGNRATGTWELDNQCRTVRFTLDFSPQSRLLADERWLRLLLFAIPYETMLDRADIQG